MTTLEMKTVICKKSYKLTENYSLQDAPRVLTKWFLVNENPLSKIDYLCHKTLRSIEKTHFLVISKKLKYRHCDTSNRIYCASK